MAVMQLMTIMWLVIVFALTLSISMSLLTPAVEPIASIKLSRAPMDLIDNYRRRSMERQSENQTVDPYTDIKSRPSGVSYCRGGSENNTVTTAAPPTQEPSTTCVNACTTTTTRKKRIKVKVPKVLRRAFSNLRKLKLKRS